MSAVCKHQNKSDRLHVRILRVSRWEYLGCFYGPLLGTCRVPGGAFQVIKRRSRDQLIKGGRRA